jgi:hypothetical protein
MNEPAIDSKNPESDFCIPIAKSPLDEFRGTGKKAKKPPTEPKEKKKPGRKPKVKPLVRLEIRHEPITLCFD